MSIEVLPPSPPELGPKKQAKAVSLPTVIFIGILTFGIGLFMPRFIGWPPGPIPEQPTPTIPSSSPTSTATQEVSPTPSLTPSLTPSPTGTPTPTATATATPSPTPIVFAPQELGYLTSVVFPATTFVEYTEERLGPDYIIYMVAVGNIQAGIDMTRIRNRDVTIKGTKVEITLPHAEVTSIEMLPSESRILDVGWFPPEGSEINALEQARVQLEDWAVTQGNVLKIAEKFGKAQLENFLRQLGFEEVNITFE